MLRGWNADRMGCVTPVHERCVTKTNLDVHPDVVDNEQPQGGIETEEPKEVAHPWLPFHPNPAKTGTRVFKERSKQRGQRRSKRAEPTKPVVLSAELDEILKAVVLENGRI
jgi:hypothetical protein